MVTVLSLFPFCALLFVPFFDFVFCRVCCKARWIDCVVSLLYTVNTVNVGVWSVCGSQVSLL